MVEETRYPRFSLPKTVSPGQLVERGGGHRLGLEIATEIVPKEIERIKQYYKKPAEGNFQEEELLKSLAQKRRRGVVDYMRIGGASSLLKFTEDDKEIQFGVDRRTTKVDYIAQIAQVVEKSQKQGAPANNEEFLEKEEARYRAIGFAEVAWLHKDFIRALEAYRAAQWLDSDVEAATTIPKNLAKILLEPYKADSTEETKIIGRDLEGKEVVQTLTPTERKKQLLAVIDRLGKWKEEGQLTPQIAQNFSSFLELDREKLQRDYHEPRLLELTPNLFVPPKRGQEHTAEMAAYQIGEQLKEGFTPTGKGLDDLKRAFESLDPDSIAMRHLKDGIRDHLAGREPELAVAIISEGVNSTTIRNWHIHVNRLEELVTKYGEDPELGDKVKTLIENVLLSTLARRIHAGELTRSARAKAFYDAFRKIGGSKSRAFLDTLKQIGVDLANAEKQTRHLSELMEQAKEK